MYTIPPMSARRVAVLAGVALAFAAPASAGERRFGVAVVGDGVEAEDGDASGGGGAAAREAAGSLRADLAARGVALVPPGELRGALEGPLPADDGDAAALARARQRLAAAGDAYAGFQYERALAALELIDRQLIDRQPSPALIALLAERHLLAGLVHEGRGRPADARRSFRTVHHLDPARRSLDAGAYRPQVVSLFAQVVKAQERRASLRVATDPPGGRVWIDGRLAGEAPVSRDDLAAGEHWVVAAAPGRRAHGAMVEVDPDRSDAGLSLALAARSPVERARALRRRIGAAGSERERRASAAELARAAGVDVLVLVRDRGGQVEGAALDARTGALSAWQPVPSARFTRQLAGSPAPPAPAAGAEVEGPDPLIASAPATATVDAAPSWYSTWWGRTLIVAGGVAVGGAVIYAVSAGGDSSYTVGDFCFDGRDC